MIDDLTSDSIQDDPSIIERRNRLDTIRAYLEQLDSGIQSGEKLALLREAAHIHENELGQPEEAFRLMLQAFLENPTNIQTLASVERLAETTGKWEELYHSVSGGLRVTVGRRAQFALCLKIGDWCFEKLDHWDYAFDYYSQALNIIPGDSEAYLRLASLYRHSGQWKDLADVLQLAADCTADKDQKRAFLLEQGEVLEQHVNDAVGAARAFEQVLELDPGCSSALDALERLCHEQEEWWQLVSVLRRKLTVTEDKERQIELRMRLGELLAQKAGDKEGAVEEYLNVLDAEPKNLKALESLESLYDALGRPVKVVETIQKRVSYAEKDEDKIELMERLATMLAEEFFEWDRSAKVWGKVLELDPTHERAEEELELIYRRRKKWPLLAGLLKKKIDNAKDPKERTELLLQRGQTLGERMGDWESALEVFEQVLANEPDHMMALEGLSRAQVEQERWAESVDTLKRLLGLVTDKRKRIELLFWLATIIADRQNDPQASCEFFQKILEIDDTHLPAIRALSKVYVTLEKWGDLVDLLIHEEDITESRSGKAKLCCEIGKVCGQMKNPAAEQKWYENALEHNPYNQLAAESLVDIYQEAGRHEEAESLLKMLIRLGADRSDEEKQQLYEKLSETKKSLGKSDEYLAAARKAAAFVGTKSTLPALNSLLQAAIENGNFREAEEACEKIQRQHLKSLSPAERAKLFYHLGLSHFHLKSRSKARSYLTQALQLDPSDRGTLQLMSEISMQENKLVQAMGYKRELADLLPEQERFSELVEIADVYQKKLGNAFKAIEALEKALEIEPKDRSALHSLLTLYQQTEKWDSVVDIITRLAEIEDDPVRMAHLYYTMGVVRLEELHQPLIALQNLNFALDENPDDERSFKAVVKLIARSKDWEELEQNYKRMLRRLEGRNNADFEVKLLRSLGELYYYRLKDYAAAAETFENAIVREPENIDFHDRLAASYWKMDGQAEEAIAKYRYLISQRPNEATYYKRLGGLMSKLGRSDEAWCVSQVLVSLGKANAKEAAFYRRYRPSSPPELASTLSSEQWRTLLSHPNDTADIAEIFAAVTGPVLKNMIRPRDQHGVARDTYGSVNDAYGVEDGYLVTDVNNEVLAKILKYVGRVLGIQAVPNFHVKRESSDGFSYRSTEYPASFCGDRFLHGRTRIDELFLMTKHLAYYRPGRKIRWIFPSAAELKALLVAAIQTWDSSYRPPGAKMETIAHYGEILARLMSMDQLGRTRTLARRFVESGQSASITQWIEGLEFTACRAALLLDGDLVRVAPMVRSERAFAVGPSLTRKVEDLQVYSISREYAQLRRDLGLSIDLQKNDEPIPPSS